MVMERKQGKYDVYVQTEDGNKRFTDQTLRMTFYLVLGALADRNPIQITPKVSITEQEQED